MAQKVDAADRDVEDLIETMRLRETLPQLSHFFGIFSASLSVAAFTHA